MAVDRQQVRRDDQLAMLSRLEWVVLRSGHHGHVRRRWFTRISVDAPDLAIRLSM